MGCDVTDILDNRKNQNIKYYYVTSKDSCPYLISYTIFTNNNYRDMFYKKLVEEVYRNNENIKESSKIDITVRNYYIERETSGNYYKSAVINKNTILYINVDKK